jgi:hypothetical protein
MPAMDEKPDAPEEWEPRYPNEELRALGARWLDPPPAVGPDTAYGFDLGHALSSATDLEEARRVIREARGWRSGPRPRSDFEERDRRLEALHARQLSAVGGERGIATMAHRWHLRVRYRRFIGAERVTAQRPLQHPSAMRTGLLYDLQRDGGSGKFQVFWVFEDADGVVRWPFLPTDEGVARGLILYARAIPQHRLLMEAGEGFVMTDMISQPLAACELLELHDQPVVVDGRWL